MKRRLYVDMTTIFQEIGRHPHGTTRVERGIVGYVARIAPPDVEFVRYDRAIGSFVIVSAEQAAAVATAAAVQDTAREPEPTWRRHPLVMRARLLRRHLRTRLAAAKPALPTVPLPHDEPIVSDSILLLVGEHDRHDFAHLMRLRRDKQLSLVFLFYDLLHVLPDDDPRLGDPLSADLPQTDFMIREASLILPISQVSAGELRRHLKRRGIAGPPVIPVRLAGELPRRDPAPVPGLEPGKFVLSVGDVVFRKNHALLVNVWRAWSEQDATVPPLVIVGRIDQEGEALVESVRHDAALRDRIRFLANADDAALEWLYRNCRFTVFPSLLEGFGLPVAESLAYGKVCVASTASAIPEAGQGAAIGLDPTDAASWLTMIRQLWTNDTALLEHQARIAREFQPVTWRDTVDDILDAIASTGLAGDLPLLRQRAPTTRPRTDPTSCRSSASAGPAGSDDSSSGCC